MTLRVARDGVRGSDHTGEIDTMLKSKNIESMSTGAKYRATVCTSCNLIIVDAKKHTVSKCANLVREQDALALRVVSKLDVGDREGIADGDWCGLEERLGGALEDRFGRVQGDTLYFPLLKRAKRIYERKQR